MISENDPPDPAAVFACALSLRDACEQAAQLHHLNLSDLFHGGDQFYREAMRIAALFEEWACAHVVFEDLADVWPYLLEEKFGEACLQRREVESLNGFDVEDCPAVAMKLLLSLHFNHEPHLPLAVGVPNPVPASSYTHWRIQTVRRLLGEEDFEPMVYGDDPFDAEYEPAFITLYGVNAEGHAEHVKDFSCYADAVTFAGKLAPGVGFPHTPVVAPASR